MRNDVDLRNSKYGWVPILNDVVKEHVFKSLRSDSNQTCSSVLVMTRINSLASKSKALLDSLGARFNGAPLKAPQRFLRDSNIDEIPNGIGDLVHSKTLDLKGTVMAELPHGILRLKSLHHLLVYRSKISQAVDDDQKYGVNDGV
ncbi:hypothetical protein EUGRSUZ_E01264 [Eucalyptus grandis]|uniref:Uncharacterized protein n=2 Tax=Eucalyptus grandis TaxID=71139 RepID=A0ACC3KW25_EUCGR|nr:hypothetical protein EUGRSUZ_E01264 [Eucalyptus grandis]